MAELKRAVATRPIVVYGQRREEDEEFLCAPELFDQLHERGYAMEPGEEAPEPEPEPEPEEAEEPEAEEAEEEAADEEPVEGEPEWPMEVAPETYLKRWPDGDHADTAREILRARGEELPG